jgi:hypothetical protein
VTARILEELRLIRAQLDRIEGQIQPRAKGPETPLTVSGFAAAVGRGPDWVYDQIAARLVKVLPGGKPYRIPASEVERFNRLKK